MADPAGMTSQQLFKQWRNGEAEAGRAMAQRFSDWYYAITAARLGPDQGRAPMERSCQVFQQGIVEVTKANLLLDWAHGIVEKELQSAGNRGPGGDFPSPISNNQSPTQLIQQVGGSLSQPQVELLNKTYNGAELNVVASLAEQQGGMPFALWQARDALKQALKGAGVGFTIQTDAQNLDWGPVPLYEAAKLQGAQEDRAFERWMLSDSGLCRDIAEFAPFAHALRAGALSTVTGSKAAAASKAPPSSAPMDDEFDVPKSGMSSTQLALAAGGGFVLVLIIGVVIMMMAK